MSDLAETPFFSIESAQEYLALLTAAVEEARKSVEDDIPDLGIDLERRREALRLVAFKLDKLEKNLVASRRVLNDLRTLRRLLLQERGESEPARRFEDSRV